MTIYTNGVFIFTYNILHWLVSKLNVIMHIKLTLFYSSQVFICHAMISPIIGVHVEKGKENKMGITTPNYVNCHWEIITIWEDCNF